MNRWLEISLQFPIADFELYDTDVVHHESRKHEERSQESKHHGKALRLARANRAVYSSALEWVKHVLGHGDGCQGDGGGADEVEKCNASHDAMVDGSEALLRPYDGVQNG